MEDRNGMKWISINDEPVPAGVPVMAIIDRRLGGFGEPFHVLSPVYYLKDAQTGDWRFYEKTGDYLQQIGPTGFYVAKWAYYPEPQPCNDLKEAEEREFLANSEERIGDPESDRKKTVQQWIDEYLKRKEISQTELASRLAITDVTLSRLRTEGRLPKVNVLKRIAAEIGITLDELLEAE